MVQYRNTTTKQPEKDNKTFIENTLKKIAISSHISTIKQLVINVVRMVLSIMSYNLHSLSHNYVQIRSEKIGIDTTIQALFALYTCVK